MDKAAPVTCSERIVGGEVCAFVAALGLLNQSVAQVCQRVTLMAAGLPLTLKAVP